jgi:long-chain acyl-CoA synthetase
MQNTRSTLVEGPDLADDQGLMAIVEQGLARDPAATAVSVLADGVWQDVSWGRLAADVDATAARLVGAGLAAGTRLGVLGRTSYPWVVADLAAAAVGVITVPLFPTASTVQMSHVLGDSGAIACLAEDSRDGDVPDVPAWSLESLAGDGTWDGPVADDATVAARRSAVRADDIASLVYTSGTTGSQKGCILTHRNLYVAAAAVVAQCADLLDPATNGPQSTLVGLPLAHVFGRTVLQAGLLSGSRTGLLPGLPELVGQLATFEPTWLAVVPYALEKLRKAIVAAGGAANVDQGRHPILGTALRNVICGGARLDPTVAAYFGEQGVTILQAYGLTESATAVSVNVPETNRFDTVGRPVPGTTVAISDDGELLVRGRQVSPGYWPDPQGSPDGWLHTGDLAEIDSDGAVRITGRRKEILVTTGGKNVAPVPLEDRLRLHPLVANAMVLADDRPFVTALIVLDAGGAALWEQAHGRPADPDDKELRAAIDAAVQTANATVSRAESIRRWTLLTRDFTVADGHLTPTMKLRRASVEDAFRAEVEELYA